MSDNLIPRIRLSRNHDSVVDILKQRNPKTCMGFARTAFNNGKTRPIQFRREQLQHLKKFISENEDELVEALSNDFKRSRHESRLAELDFVKNELAIALSNLKSWTKREVIHKKLIFLFDKAMRCQDPLGVVLIVGAWDYPLKTCLLPMIGCIAAGNSFVLKPSSISGHTTRFLAKILPMYLDHECYQVYLGNLNELLLEKFDYIFYTGQPNQGALVSKAAASNLTPVTLVMGGKTPVYIDDSANIDLAAKRIMWGKCVSAGQTDVAPEYLLCSKTTQEKFIKAAESALKEFYKEDIRASKDYARIINDHHFERLVNIISNHKVCLGGDFNKEERFISPTIITDVTASSLIMDEVIYGPILKIITISNIANAIKIINSSGKPLAMYIFSSNKQAVNEILENTSCGGVTVNDTLMHTTCMDLPFGGVGASGMGAYHGKMTFDTFVHKKSVFQRPESFLMDTIEKIRYPPYHNVKMKSLHLLLMKNKGLSTKTMSYMVVFFLGFVLAIFVMIVYECTGNNCFKN